MLATMAGGRSGPAKIIFWKNSAFLRQQFHSGAGYQLAIPIRTRVGRIYVFQRGKNRQTRFARKRICPCVRGHAAVDSFRRLQYKKNHQHNDDNGTRRQVDTSRPNGGGLLNIPEFFPGALRSSRLSVLRSMAFISLILFSRLVAVAGVSVETGAPMGFLPDARAGEGRTARLR